MAKSAELLQGTLDLLILRTVDLPQDATIARAAATFYQGAREVKAVLQLPQLLELT